MIENILILSYTEDLVGKAKVSSLYLFLDHIAIENGLNLRKVKDWDKAKEILINSIKYN